MRVAAQVTDFNGAFSTKRQKPEGVAMLAVSQQIMEIFRRQRIGMGESLSRPSLERVVVAEWDRGLQDKLSDGLNELVKLEYIKMGDDRGFLLTDTGYDYLYSSRA
jgi:hypothetical protein